MLKFSGFHKPAPCLLLGSKPLVAGYALGPIHSLGGEREHLVGAALRTMGRVLPGVTGANHPVHGPPRRVGVSLEVSFGQVAVGDVAVHSHVRYRSIRPVLESLPLRPAGIVFAPVAVALPFLPLFRVVAPGASFGRVRGSLARSRGSNTAAP